jgi:hypothetical protein
MEDIKGLPYAMTRATLDPIALAARGDAPSGPAEFADYVMSMIPGGAAAKAPLMGALGIMAGRKAKTANPVAFNLAKQMQEQGRPAEDIWRVTSQRHEQPWWLGHPDQVPRFEIPDELAEYNPEKLGRGGRVKDALEHDDLFEAYPDLEHTRNVWERDLPPGGEYRSRPHETITVEGRDNPLSIMLHELQHGVQKRERMARGGSPGDFSYQPSTAKTTEANELSKIVNSEFAEKLDQAKGDWKEIMRLGAANPDEYRAINDALSRYQVATIEELRSLPKKMWAESDALTPSEQYRRLGGEMDARAVQARRAMTPEQRVERPFWLDYDLPMSEMILKR